MDYNFDKIKTSVLELPEKEQLILIKLIEEKLETRAMMKLSETGFQEWNHPEEDIYNDYIETKTQI
ncbi:hypothetical protein RIVM261_089430 [Rivularia sp. IAM M-261]|nr:hypothetical protein CAL7716_002510 [Calothrix sp. PCC 7716]GJD23987.1 hypothetical protein RIVM261_089430 [Rivularia sp. IAM M-261]